jgi:hypothetical protein
VILVTAHSPYSRESSKAEINEAEINTKESTMTRISTLCVLSTTLAALALSANAASAGNVTPHFSTPTPTPKPLATGQHFPKTTIGSATGGGGSGKITTTGNQSIQWSGSSGGDRPTESTSLNFTKQQVQYTNQTSGGLKTDRASPVLFDKHKDW